MMREGGAHKVPCAIKRFSVRIAFPDMRDAGNGSRVARAGSLLISVISGDKSVDSDKGNIADGYRAKGRTVNPQSLFTCEGFRAGLPLKSGQNHKSWEFSHKICTFDSHITNF